MTEVRKGQPLAAPKDYAEELGWVRQRTAESIVFTGYFRAPALRYRGWILQEQSGKFNFFIHRPPIELIRDTDSAGCFHPKNDGWWLITFKPDAQPADIASGIAAIQKVLRKAFEVRLARRTPQ
jgi:hypothetical protein